jgi:hypothetical protein
MNRPPTFSPAHKKADAAKAKKYLRKRSDTELNQIIASPRALVDKLPGFTLNHLRTAEADVTVEFAKAELNRRNTWWSSLRGSGLSIPATIAGGLIVAALIAWFTHPRHVEPVAAPALAPPHLVRGTLFQPRSDAAQGR